MGRIKPQCNKNKSHCVKKHVSWFSRMPASDLMGSRSPVEFFLKEHLCTTPPHQPSPPPISPLTLQPCFSPSFLFCDQDKGAVILELLVTMAMVLRVHLLLPPFSHSQVRGPSGLEASHFCCHSSVQCQVETGTQDSHQCNRDCCSRGEFWVMKMK